MHVRLGLILSSAIISASLSGCGTVATRTPAASLPQQSAQHGPATFQGLAPLRPGFKPVNIFSTVVAIPKTWTTERITADSITLGGQTGSCSVTNLTPSLSLATRWLPLSTSPTAPYKDVVSVSASTGSGSKTILTQTGQLLELSVHVPPSHQRLGTTILRTWQHPLIATTTQAVTHLEQAQNAVLANAGSREWVLAAGNAATAQESFYLFQSQNGGKKWTLENASQWNTNAPVFPNASGQATINFPTTSEGFIAELSAMQPILLIYRTESSGKTWTKQIIHLPSSFWPGNKAPVIHFSSPTDGQILAPLSQTNLDALYNTNNGGATWRFVQMETVSACQPSHTIIREALHHDATQIALPLFGPTRIPHARNQSLSATASASPSLNQYSVRIWKTQQCYPVNSPEITHDLSDLAPFASWRVTAVSPQAPTTALLESGNLYWRAPSGHPHTVTLATGLIGQAYPASTLFSSQALSHGPVLIWHEGEWTMEIKGGTAVSEQTVSSPLIRYLHTHFLPGYQGLLVVNITGTNRMQTRLDWDQGPLFMQVASDEPSADNPVTTARLAVLWQQYS